MSLKRLTNEVHSITIIIEWYDHSFCRHRLKINIDTAVAVCNKSKIIIAGRLTKNGNTRNDQWFSCSL